MSIIRSTIQGHQTVFTMEEDGGYTVHVPSLLGCFTEGDNLQEAKAKAKEAIELHLSVLRDFDSQGTSE